jgi:23S rRNA (cytidine1920-2'-O)/16S rRNA (cytidine1409-2'-O)-methyltransferase
VWAVDVGRGQLHDRLRRDPRVVPRDRTNVRTVSLDDLGGTPFDLVVADLSFISLRTVTANLAGNMAAPAADLVWLVKPQFEAGRAIATAARGVIRDPAVWREALLAVGRSLDTVGAAIMGAMASPLRGAEGNVEFLLWARARTDRGGGRALDDVVGEALAEVGA